MIFDGLPIYYILIAIKNILSWTLVIIEHDASIFNLIDFTNPIILTTIIVLLVIILGLMVKLIIIFFFNRNIFLIYIYFYYRFIN